jgi:hypothetical protein
MLRECGVRGQLQKVTHLDLKERQHLENEALARRHIREKQDFEWHRRTLARLETREKHLLEKALRREQRLAVAPCSQSSGYGPLADRLNGKIPYSRRDPQRDLGCGSTQAVKLSARSPGPRLHRADQAQKQLVRVAAI